MHRAGTRVGEFLSLGNGRDVPPALDLSHCLCLWNKGIVAKGQNDGACSDDPEEFRDLAEKLLAIVPDEEILRLSAHEANLAVAEECFQLEWDVFCEGFWGFVLETGDPDRVSGQLVCVWL